MGQLILLLVAAAWAAVLIPPLLRARIENRPNNSVSDFRDQLSSLQQTMPGGGAVQMRSMGRSLVGSPLERPAAAGRPGGPAGSNGDATLKSISINTPASPEVGREPAEGDRRRRQRRPAERRHPNGATRTGPSGDPLLEGPTSRRSPSSRSNREAAPRNEAPRERPRRDPSNEESARERRHRQTRSHRELSARQTLQRRRSNVLFVLVLLAACSLFLAVTTQVSAAMYVFVLSFLALAGYIYMLGQARQTAGAAAPAPRRGDPAPRAQHHRPVRDRNPRERAPQSRPSRSRRPATDERWLDIA